MIDDGAIRFTEDEAIEASNSRLGAEYFAARKVAEDFKIKIVRGPNVQHHIRTLQEGRSA